MGVGGCAALWCKANGWAQLGSLKVLTNHFGKTKCDRPAATVCCRPIVANLGIALLMDVLVALLACVGSHAKWSVTRVMVLL